MSPRAKSARSPLTSERVRFRQAKEDLIAALARQPADSTTLSMNSEEALLRLYGFSLTGRVELGRVLVAMLKRCGPSLPGGETP